MSTEVKIVCRPDVRGGTPSIDGTRISVTDIVRIYRTHLPAIVAWYEGPPHPGRGFGIDVGTIVEAVRTELPHLSKEQVTAAFSYWYENEDEVGRELAEEDIAAIEARRKYSRLP